MASNNGIGLQNADKETRERVARQGGLASAKSGHTTGTSSTGKMSRSEAGKMGAQAQSKADKSKGGHNSHK